MTDSVLVIEDSDAKLVSVVAALTAMLPLYPIETAKSVRSAVAALETNTFRLAVADMSLPTLTLRVGSGGLLVRSGGIEVFDYLMRVGLETPVIVVSSYQALVDGSASMPLEKLAADLARDYPDNYSHAAMCISIRPTRTGSANSGHMWRKPSNEK